MKEHNSSSMEMIIRRFAGIFILASLALGWWVHPGWYLLTAFVGLNLFLSSLTGICPLESILRKFGVGRGNGSIEQRESA